MTVRRDVDGVEADLAPRPRAALATAAWVLLALAGLSGGTGVVSGLDTARLTAEYAYSERDRQAELIHAKIAACVEHPNTLFCRPLTPRDLARAGSAAERRAAWLQQAGKRTRGLYPSWQPGQPTPHTDPYWFARSWLVLGVAFLLASVLSRVTSRRGERIAIRITPHKVVLDGVEVPTRSIAGVRWADGQLVLELWDGGEVRSRATDELALHALVDEVEALRALPTEHIQDDAAEQQVRAAAQQLRDRT